MMKQFGVTTLWLPLRHRRNTWICTLLLFLVYIATMSRDMWLYDSPELALVAYQLGLGHPIGQPLHTILGFLFSHTYLVSPLFGLNMLSALFGAITAVPVISISDQLVAFYSIKQKEIPSYPIVMAVGLCGLHAALWEPATRIEVYPLAVFFSVWAAAGLCCFLGEKPLVGRHLFFVGLALGLAASANPFFVVFFAVSISPRLSALLMKRELGFNHLLIIWMGGIVGLIPYLYIPLVANRSDVFIWGEPKHTKALLHYFMGKDFSQNLGISLGLVFDHIVEWVTWAFRRVLLPLPVIGIAGYIVFAKGKGVGQWFSLVAFIVVLSFIASNTIWHPENPDYLGYLGLPLWLSVAGIGAITGYLYNKYKKVYSFLFLLFLASLSLFSPPSLLQRKRHLDRVTRIMGEGAMKEAGEDSILVVESDHWVAPLLYLQLAERKREDLVIMAFGLASSSWYWEQLFRRHPTLHRIPLRGPSGRLGRVKRFLAANDDRPIRFEHLRLAKKLDREPCPSGWLLTSGIHCSTRTDPVHYPDEVLEQSLELLGNGSPSTDELIASVSFRRGEAMLRLGFLSASMDAFLSGIPKKMRPSNSNLKVEEHASYTITNIRFPNWQKSSALGDPARNLYIISKLLFFTGNTKDAVSYLTAAAAAGLHEAETELAAIFAGISSKSRE